MKIAICHRQDGFSEFWIRYCEQNAVDYKTVNPYSNDIVQQVADCNAFMWHFHHCDYRDMQFAKGLILALETKGVKCFPNSRTCWHFDDKIAQKYLLESIGAPLVPSYVFYTERDALAWAETTTFPKVFKLKNGASASNVKMVRDKSEAARLIKTAFGKGFRQYRWLERFKEERRRYKMGKGKPRDVLRTLYYALKKYPTEFDHYRGREAGYVYFQDFIPDNQSDTRITVIGEKAFGLKRMCRKNDFRASGSGDIVYRHTEINETCVQTAFEIVKKIGSQCLALDFIFDKENRPLVVEISYGSPAKGFYDLCEGYWTSDMQWHECQGFDFCGWMVEDLINAQCETKKDNR